MNYHHTTKQSEKIYSCDSCEYRTSTKGSLKYHKEGKHGEEKYSCSKCEYRTKWKAWLKGHSKTAHNPVQTNVCDLCKYSSTNSRIFKLHICQVGGALKCARCNFRTLSSEELDRHCADSHVDKLLCDKCDFRAEERKLLKIHESNYHSPKGYKCNECDHDATSIHMLHHHKKRVHGEKKCEKCNEEFTTFYYFDAHNKLVHQGGFPCPFCDFKGKTSGETRGHTTKEHSSTHLVLRINR